MAPPLVRKSATLPLPCRPDGTARIVAVADTHSQPHALMAKHLATLKPDAILHAGDIGELSVLDALREVAPLFAVRGNIDTRAHQLPDFLTIEMIGGERTLRVLLTHIAVVGPRLRGDVAKIARQDKATLVVCGHSHVPFIGEDKGLTVFNPGSIGPRRFGLPIVFGTIDLTRDRVRLAHVDCETGLPWSPP